MKKVVILSIFSLLLSVYTYSQEKGFQYIIDNGFTDGPGRFEVDHNGNMIGPIFTRHTPEDKGYVRLMKINMDGDTTVKIFAKQDTTLAFHQILPVDGGYFIIGHIALDTGYPRLSTLYTLFLDFDYNIVWERILNTGIGFTQGKACLQTKDGNFLVGESGKEGGTTNKKMLLVTLSPHGDSLSSRVFDPLERGTIQSMALSSDSSIIYLFGINFYFQSGLTRHCIAMDTSLNILNHWKLKGSSVFTGKRYVDNNFIVGTDDGKIDPEHQVPYHFLRPIIMDSAMNILHTNETLCYSDTTSSPAVKCLDFYYPESIYFGGTFNPSLGYPKNWIYVAKLNDTLGLIWEKYIGGDNNYYTSSINATPDGGVLLSAVHAYPVPDSYSTTDAILIKLTPEGSITGNSGEYKPMIQEAIVYPNPGKDNLYVRTALKDCSIQLFDAQGRVVRQSALSSHVSSIDMSNLPAGNYLYRIIQSNDKHVLSGSWIKH